MPSTEELVDMGFSGIIVLECDSHESRSGMQEEVTRTTVACRDRQGNPHELVFVKVDHPLRRATERVESRRSLPPKRYAELAAKRGISDTEQFRRERENRRAQAAAAQAELDGLVPQCPSCGGVMVIRQNRSDTARRFWGCTTFRWSGCRGTRDISTALSARLDQLGATIAAAR